MKVEEIHAILDGDQDLQRTIARWVNQCKTYDVISFSNYRNLRCRHQGWKPVSLQEYRLKLRGDQIALKKFQEQEKRMFNNQRIQDAADASNPLNTIA
jgi:hypothetical protein